MAQRICLHVSAAAKVGCRGAKCTEVLLEDTSGWELIREDDRGMMKRKATEGKNGQTSSGAIENSSEEHRARVYIYTHTSTQTHTPITTTSSPVHPHGH